MTEAGIPTEWRVDENAGLSFDRTVDRRLVHRSAVSEVFITDLCPLSSSRVALAAQLPTCHAYFGDHEPPTAIDPLLVMEICRQAGLATAYELGISTDVVLVPKGWDLRVAMPARWSGATDLRIDSEFSWTRVRRGRPRAGTCTQRVFAGGQQIGTLRAENQFLGYDELEMLRTAQRGTPPPSTDALADRTDPGLAAPHLVGRRDRNNVVLADLVRGADEVSARVVLPLANRALFDHSYDHITMQVLIEAARQLAVSAAEDRQVTGLAGTFMRFAELDTPVTVRAARPGSPAAGPEFIVVVEQDGAAVAEIELRMTPVRREP